MNYSMVLMWGGGVRLRFALNSAHRPTKVSTSKEIFNDISDL